ncbi:hypothetical protein L3476_15560 [Paenibacillus thiaminolyticus]|uniref:hypothetical protein n=1 Tax=Paenibacillus thiaminolyticus TaxID=49283 RepID=UPI00234FDA9C|nr:hypothetical protein [Paenibacillus thiaminolyticus]WCR24805.1 hypothetical protein L3476_15560 [Paenibacillus thiaminolyticus]
MYSATEVKSLIFCRPRLLVDLVLHDRIDEVDRFYAVIDAAGTASLLVGRQQRIGHIHVAFGGDIRSGCGLNMWRELLLFYRNFGSMSPHSKELLQIYIILGPFASSRSETGEIPAVLQDSLSSKVVHIELLYLLRISLTE